MQKDNEVKIEKWQDVLYKNLKNKDTPQWIKDLKEKPNTRNK